MGGPICNQEIEIAKCICIAELACSIHTVVPAKVAEEGASEELEDGDATPTPPDEPHRVILHSRASLQVRVETLLVLVAH